MRYTNPHLLYILYFTCCRVCRLGTGIVSGPSSVPNVVPLSAVSWTRLSFTLTVTVVPVDSVDCRWICWDDSTTSLRADTAGISNSNSNHQRAFRERKPLPVWLNSTKSDPGFEFRFPDFYLWQRRRYMFLPVSVCLCARLLKNVCMDLDGMLRVDRCRDMDELVNFWARSGL